MQLLHSMAGPACIQCLVLSIGVAREDVWWKLSSLNASTVTVVFLSAVAALGLNWTAFSAYQAASPVTCCITAAVKQVLLVGVATPLFGTPVSFVNAIGMVIVLVASGYYSYLSVIEKGAAKVKEEKMIDDVDTELDELLSLKNDKLEELDTTEECSEDEEEGILRETSLLAKMSKSTPT